MKRFINILIFIVILFVCLFTSHATKEDDIEQKGLKLTSFRGRGSLLPAYRFRPYSAAMTCDRSVKVCRAKGRAGRCVNLKTDRYNCGKCGKKCKYSEICCKGKCVNPMLNRKHCGGCNSTCSRGSLCVYGMCGLCVHDLYTV